jgi:diguanylate cyclase (GGDEF)-like protein/PAS domain S-box-containing protein
VNNRAQARLGVVQGALAAERAELLEAQRIGRIGSFSLDLLALAPVGIGLFDNSARLLDANDALCELLGYPMEELRGREVRTLLHPDELGRYERDSAAIWADEEHPHTVPESRLRRADGRSVYCEVHLASSVADDGNRFWLAVFSDVTEAREAAEALRYRATHDELTGLPTRFAAKELLGQLLESAGGTAPDVAVLFCDIDNFKRINDSLGHDAGDEVLVSLARRLENGLPSGALAARLSGDEFLIVCPDLDAAGGVEALTRRVSAVLREPVPVRGQLVRASASIGAAVPEGGEAGVDLLRFADTAMFEAKRRGPGRVTTASATSVANAEGQVRAEGQLREALAGAGPSRLVLHYQPVVAACGRLLAAEALVRWAHPERGLLAPEEFLPVAEEGDLLGELDRWVLRTALAHAATWPEVAGRRPSIAVNLAALTPGQPGFEDILAETIAESGIDARRVALELVETKVVDLSARGRAAMQALTARGVRFAIDDFGIGYSSLARLKNLPARTIKVDRQFTAGVADDASDRALARAVVDMARAMSRRCVAEGVESSAQFEVLRRMGVDGYQGWLFAKALPHDELAEVLAAGSIPAPRP